jgi:DNA-binding GntR family transcriptional regulator
MAIVDRQPRLETAALTYEEVGRHLGISADGARKLAARADWPRTRRADGRVLVRVSEAEIARYKAANRRPAEATQPPAGPALPAKATSIAAIVRTLRERIATHAIPPGAKLLEAELAREFNVSRARIRDAFVALEMLGVVERNRGAMVSRLDLDQVFEIYDVREALEGLCVRLAVQNTASESWSDLAARFDAISEERLRNGEIAEYETTYTEFRDRILAAARNTVLQSMLDSICEKTQVIMRRVMILPGRPEKGLAEHRAVLAAMLRGDAFEAERLRRANIRSAIEDLKRYQRFVF